MKGVRDAFLRTFRIRDTVEDLRDLVGIVDLDGDGMRVLQGIQVQNVLEVVEHEQVHPGPIRFHLKRSRQNVRATFTPILTVSVQLDLSVL